MSREENAERAGHDSPILHCLREQNEQRRECSALLIWENFSHDIFFPSSKHFVILFIWVQDDDDDDATPNFCRIDSMSEWMLSCMDMCVVWLGSDLVFYENCMPCHNSSHFLFLCGCTITAAE